MAEPLSVAAGAIAVVQIADRVVGLCKEYIESVKGYPQTLRKILIEISSLKDVFQNLLFLNEHDIESSDMLQRFVGSDGPVGLCHRNLAELELLLGPQVFVESHKKQRLSLSLAGLAWPFKEGKIRKLMEEISQSKATINLAFSFETMLDIKDVKHTVGEVLATVSQNEQHNVHTWLLRDNPSSNHLLAVSQYESGTGDWVLRSSEWKGWINLSWRCLWIHGIPGAGKTVLASHLINAVENHLSSENSPSVTLVYYYCYHGRNQDETASLLRWLVSRLCRHNRTIPASLYELYRRDRPIFVADLLRVLEEVLLGYDTVYFVVDAVDESQSRDQLLKVLRDFVLIPAYSKIQLLVTSREYPDIRTVMTSISQPVSMSSPLVDADIQLYTRNALKVGTFKRWPPDLAQEIQIALSAGAHGMFRWVVCQLDVLRRLRDESAIRVAIRNLPETLDETYHRIFSLVPEKEWPFLRHVLRWICFHNQFQTDMTEPSPLVVLWSSANCLGCSPKFYNLDVLQEICGCMVTVTRGNESEISGRQMPLVINLAHYTVREFLESDRIAGLEVEFFALNDNYEDILEVLLTLALDDDGHLGIAGPEEWTDEPSSADPWEDFHDYALSFSDSILSFHIDKYFISQFAEGNKISPKLLVLIINLLQPGTGYINYCKLYDSELQWTQKPEYADAIALAYMLCRELYNLAEALLAQADIDRLFNATMTVRTKSHSEPWFISGGIIELFADRLTTSDLIAADTPFMKFLNIGYDYLDKNRTLLTLMGTIHINHGLEMNLDCVSECIILRLLKDGAATDAPDMWVTPLQLAVNSRDDETVLGLLQAGANPNGIGDEHAKGWGMNLADDRFDHIRGCSPLHICRHWPVDDIDAEDIGSLEAIEKGLLLYGAKEFGASGGYIPRCEIRQLREYVWDCPLLQASVQVVNETGVVEEAKHWEPECR